jgi:hypothetical protein
LVEDGQLGIGNGFARWIQNDTADGGVGGLRQKREANEKTSYQDTRGLQGRTPQALAGNKPLVQLTHADEDL